MAKGPVPGHRDRLSSLSHCRGRSARERSSPLAPVVSRGRREAARRAPPSTPRPGSPPAWLPSGRRTMRRSRASSPPRRRNGTGPAPREPRKSGDHQDPHQREVQAHPAEPVVMRLVVAGKRHGEVQRPRDQECSDCDEPSRQVTGSGRLAPSDTRRGIALRVIVSAMAHRRAPAATSRTKWLAVASTTAAVNTG